MDKQFMISPRTIDIFFVVVANIVAVIIAILTQSEPSKLEYIPNIVQGLTTLISILAGFMGFIIPYLISTTEDINIKNYLKRRAPYSIGIIGLIISHVLYAYILLAYGYLFASFRVMMLCAVFMFFVFLDSMLGFWLKK
jgi:flagellar biosynthesis protein FliQ